MADLKQTGVLLLGVGTACLLGCGGENQALLLDQICNPEIPMPTSEDACSVSGDAKLTTGVTGDSTAVHFGPSTGELRIRLSAIPASSQARWSLEALAASSRSEGSTLYRSLSWGSCGSDCPSDPQDVEAPLTDEFQWAAMVSQVAGMINTPPSDALLVLRGADIDLVDVRTPGFEGYYY